MTSAFQKVVEAQPHTPVYTMHKYFARRPWNVFNELISQYTSPDEIVMDPFCGGGVTIVESLKLGRKAIGVDVNPLAVYVTEMECRPLNLDALQKAFSDLATKVEPKIMALYKTKCASCKSQAFSDWVEWNEAKGRITRLKYNCPKCGSSEERKPSPSDIRLARNIARDFSSSTRKEKLWYPETRIPLGDKTSSLLREGIGFFHELFTKRNLLALSILYKEISLVEDYEARDFLMFAFSSSLKWASRQSHLRSKIVEGWAMHAYWIYPRSLEINVWNTFQRRIKAIVRGKQYSNQYIGESARVTREYDKLVGSGASCLLLNQDSRKLPLPSDFVNAIITDPPYGGNVNYAELSDYWHIWLSNGKTIDKRGEVIINRTQGKRLNEYTLHLSAVFAECYRVLKPGRCLVSTFNSKDIHVVAGFVVAASKAGFTLHPDGFLYQNPIRSYTTTFHAMQIGAFVGDFIFTFVKKPPLQHSASTSNRGLSEVKTALNSMIALAVQGGITEPQLREQAYRLLIPFLAQNASIDLAACDEATGFFEARMEEHEQHFKQIRKTITHERKRKFARRRFSH